MEPILFGVKRGEQPLSRGSSASKSLALFWFSFGAKREQSPPGCSASKSLCPCRAKHAAFASQTGLRLKSPTGAFMPCGHRRPFWFSFGAQKRTYPAAMHFIKAIQTCPTRIPTAQEAAYLRKKSKTARPAELVGARPFHLAPARTFCRLKAPLGLSLLRNRGILLSEENKKSEPFSYREKVRIICFNGSPPGRHSYWSRNRALTKAPLGLLLPRLRQGRVVQVLLSA